MSTEKKELYYCEKCKKETWFTREETRRRGSICPSSCERNFLIFLGADEEEIEKRRKEFIEKEGYEFEVNPMMDGYDEHDEGPFDGRSRYNYEDNDDSLGFRL